MSKNCIFNDRKICDSCGECEVCELNSNKKCNNCGKCLELEGYDVKAIKIDEVFEAEELQEELEADFYDKHEINLPETEENNSVNEIDELPEPEELTKFEEYDSLLAASEQSNLDKDDFIPENNEVWEYIDDIEGVKDLLENEEDNSGLLHEEFPGLITLKK
ncbi:hypothetical protein [Clostridium sp. CF012]|uniref:hypothetical protein n=1 Tax=Clostridium sp. CF012 TaxID=2843319 RepID=UPI001C0D3E03|nr:hypothetical protein [Clostridium sp. CF012]MBU3143862.1 hypothetical protein [Clostridium sp. CF012]